MKNIKENKTRHLGYLYKNRTLTDSEYYDFKSVGLGNNAIKTNYQNGMEKEILYKVKNQKKKILEKTLSEAVKSYTKSQNNGFLSIWIEEIETFKNFDMKKIRESHNTKK